jgi:O-antigen ligase
LSFHADWQTGFNLPAQTSGLIAAHTILGLVLFLPRILAGGAAAGRFRARRLLAWLLALYLSTYLLVVSQARGTWLAAIVVFAAVFGYRRLSARKAGEPAQALSQPVVAALLLVALLAVAGLARNADSFLRRAAPDLEAAGSILRGEAVNRQDSSFSYRYNVQKFGLRKWLERPLLGWGAGASRPLIEASGDPRLYQAQSGRYLGRMHNAYIEIGVRFGLVGLAFLAAAIGYSLSSLADARREGRIREDFRLLTLGGLGLLLLWGFTSTFTSAAWQAYWMLLMGLATTYSWVVKGPTEGAGGTFLVIADSRPWP